MRKLSLRWRITLSMGALVLLVSLLLTGLSIWNVSRQFVMPLSEITVPQVDMTSSADLQDLELLPKDGKMPDGVIYQEKVSLDPYKAQMQFSLSSLFCVAAMTLASMGIAYSLSGKALRPLSELSREMDAIDSRDLSRRVSVPETEDEIAHVSSAFNHLLERLELEMEREKRFSSDAAHELKTPLATIITNAQVLKMDDEPSIEDYAHNLEITLESAKRLSEVVNALLALHRHETNLTVETIDLADLFGQIRSELEPVYGSKKQTIRMDLHQAKLKGDRLLLYRAFFNLVENACKYTPDNGEIVIASHAQNDSTIVSITDNGIGMDDEAIAHVFEPFYRADASRSRSAGGAGLGMAIAKESFDLHHAATTVISFPGAGTSVRVSFTDSSEKKSSAGRHACERGAG